MGYFQADVIAVHIRHCILLISSHSLLSSMSSVSVCCPIGGGEGIDIQQEVDRQLTVMSGTPCPPEWNGVDAGRSYEGSPRLCLPLKQHSRRFGCCWLLCRTDPYVLHAAASVGARVPWDPAGEALCKWRRCGWSKTTTSPREQEPTSPLCSVSCQHCFC